MNLREDIQRIKEVMGVLNEDRYKGYKRFLRDEIFPNTPEYVLNDMFRETEDLNFRDIVGMSKDEIIDYFNNGPGKSFYERWGGFDNKKPKVIEIRWDDLTHDVQKFLKNKMSGENKNFPDSREKLIKKMENQPNLGDGNNEPILVKYNKDGKIYDIPGGNHRIYAAFELNDFNPIKMKAYISN
jgi:hypothetical protein